MYTLSFIDRLYAAHVCDMTPGWWLREVAETCRSKKNCCAVVGNKNSFARFLYVDLLNSLQCLYI